MTAQAAGKRRDSFSTEDLEDFLSPHTVFMISHICTVICFRCFV